MALHEIGYLIVGGMFQCWFWGAQSPCPNAEKINPAGIVREKANEYEVREVHYEESGFAVYEKKENSLKIKKKSGEYVSIELTELNRKSINAIPNRSSHDDTSSAPWRFETLETILKGGMLVAEGEFLSLLRKDDLVTANPIPKVQMEMIRKNRIETLLKDHQISIPVGYVLVSTACTYTKTPGDTMSGTCPPLSKAPAYSKPDRNSEKILDATLSWAHFEGRPVQFSTPNQPQNTEELLVLEEQGDWLRMKLVVLEKTKRIVWLNKKDIPYVVKKWPANTDAQIKSLVEFLRPAQASSPSAANANLAENLKLLVDQPLSFDIDAAGETKWSNGILWVKVNIRNEPHCSVEQSKAILTGWLPYIHPKTKKNVLGWISRGC